MDQFHSFTKRNHNISKTISITFFCRYISYVDRYMRYKTNRTNGNTDITYMGARFSRFYLYFWQKSSILSAKDALCISLRSNIFGKTSAVATEVLILGICEKLQFSSEQLYGRCQILQALFMQSGFIPISSLVLDLYYTL